MIRIATTLPTVLLVVLAAGGAGAQGHPHPPATGDGLGTVHFPTSCAPAVAPRFDRAMALLHSFEFGAALRAFDEVLAADSTCAMAHWGIPMARWTNPMAITEPLKTGFDGSYHGIIALPEFILNAVYMQLIYAGQPP